MPAGAKPGERRGGRRKGSPNKRTIGEVAARRAQIQEAIVKSEHFDSLDQMRAIAKLFIGMAASEQRRDKPDQKWMKELGDSAAKTLAYILPYEHRRLATLEPAMETVVKADGSVHVTISRSDAEL